MLLDYKSRIFSIQSTSEFEELALWAFRYQYANIEVYRQFVDALGIDPNQVNSIDSIPFLPIEFFRSHTILDRTFSAAALEFHSSGSTAQTRSVHWVADPDLYEKSFIKAFQDFFGQPEECIILALLPSYLERPNSSLIYMVAELIRLSQQPLAGFFSEPNEVFLGNLHSAIKSGTKTLVIGVSFALMEWANLNPVSIPQVQIMETGGMKGRAKELTREEVHSILKRAFSVRTILSEYGMTELLSQGYSMGEGIFETPSWMKILFRDPLNPMHVNAESGGINVIDLANIHSCCFISTQDLGERTLNGFRVSGRFDQSDVRGCNLLVSS
jgi:phenylacetate-coenzyme A ligase PaaK-like adenylate-forming protein